MALDTANALCTLANLKLYVGIASADTTFDSRNESYIDAASWFLNSKTKRKLLARDLTEYYDGDGGNILFAKQRPINSVASLHSDASRAFATASLIDSDDYEVYGDEGYIAVIGSGFAVGERVLKLVYNAGYTVVPLDLEQAALELAGFWYEKFKSHRTGVKSVTIGDMTTVYETFPEFVKMVAEEYTRKVIL